MQTADTSQKNGFGRRNEPHRIFIARGENVRSFTVRPWLAGMALSFVFLIVTVYLGATGYLIFRDGLIETTRDLRTEVRSAYEDRIATLRAQNDRITSRQLIDRRAYEGKIKLLLDRQSDLDLRQNRISAVIKRASQQGLAITTPLPEAKPQLAGLDSTVPNGSGGVGGETLLLDNNSTGSLGLRGSDTSDTISISPAKQTKTATDENLAIMDKVSSALGRMDGQTTTVLDAIAVSAEKRINRIETIATPLGMTLVDDGDAMGGPFVPSPADTFDARLDRADRAIMRLSALHRAIETLPLIKPVPRAKMTSRFGSRLDPFLGRPAMHTGIDYKAAYGTAVRATASGTVLSAGRNGGYGRVVEIDHGNGIVTRYAHLSRIRVAKGTQVAAGKIIGSVGSSGRSTGPHLHYETRLRGAPRDPALFLKTGQKLRTSLN